MIDHDSPEIMRPVEKPRGLLARWDDLRRFVGEAATLLASRTNPPLPGSVLILLTADDDCPADLGPRRRECAKDVDTRFEVACVVANSKYETWFAASAESLAACGFPTTRPGEPLPSDPEGRRMKQNWIEDRFRIDEGAKTYTPPADQLPMTRAMDLNACRDRSASFRKLCRELRRYAVV